MPWRETWENTKKKKKKFKYCKNAIHTLYSHTCYRSSSMFYFWQCRLTQHQCTKKVVKEVAKTCHYIPEWEILQLFYFNCVILSGLLLIHRNKKNYFPIVLWWLLRHFKFPQHLKHLEQTWRQMLRHHFFCTWDLLFTCYQQLPRKKTVPALPSVLPHPSAKGQWLP